MMDKISDSIIFLSITLMTILIPVFVFAVSLLGRAIEKSSEEKKEKEKELKRNVEISSQNLRQASEKMKETGKTDQLESDIKKYKREVKKYKKQLNRIRKIPEHLTVHGSVIKPGLCFLGAFILSSFIKYSPTIRYKNLVFYVSPLNIISLIFVLYGCWIIYQCLKVVQEISLTTEQAQLQRTIDAFESALRKHEERKRPELKLSFVDKKPPFIFNKASTNSIKCTIFLEYGDLAYDGEVRFVFPKSFKCLNLDNLESEKTEYWEACNRFGNLKKGLQHPFELKIQTPDTVGKFRFDYYLFCEGFASKCETFEIEIV